MMSDPPASIPEPLKKTALNERHRALNAKMTDFHGWEMPLYYTSIIEEHKAVRGSLGLFDISHMGQVLVHGRKAEEMLNAVLVSDFTEVIEGRACYTLMLNEQGGIIDDLIVYRLGQDAFLVIVNCGNRKSDVAWLNAHNKDGVTLTDLSAGRSMIAVQGPKAAHVLEQNLDARVAGLGRFEIAPIRTMGPEASIARTGYTGGDGFELFVPDSHAKKLWGLMVSEATIVGGLPVGLGARDTLRVEAGLRLYGTDMDAKTTPLEAGLSWTVAMNKPNFIGKAALERQRAEGIPRRFVGIEFASGPVPREGYELRVEGRRVGSITSGTFSPIMNKPLGMGYVEPDNRKPGTVIEMVVRGKGWPGKVVSLPFWKQEKKPIALESHSQARPGSDGERAGASITESSS